MPHNKNDGLSANAFIERLFRDGYHDYVRYTEINLQKHGSKYLSTRGCAEDVVQEAFYLICERPDDIMNSESPVGWVYRALNYKIRETLRRERKWNKYRINMIFPSERISDPTEEVMDLEAFIGKEDCRLLEKLYLEGYTYQEVSDELGIKKSTLGMRVTRIKDRCIEKFEKFFGDV